MQEVGLHTLRPDPGRRRRKRVGRGPGSGHGKTAGKGHKGQKARSGGAKGPGFEGGQMPIQMRVPKRGFTNAPFRRRWQVVNLRELADWPADVPVSPAALAERRLADAGGGPVKLLGDGEVASPLLVQVDAVSAAARAKIEAAGGRVVSPPASAEGPAPGGAAEAQPDRTRTSAPRRRRRAAREAAPAGGPADGRPGQTVSG